MKKLFPLIFIFLSLSGCVETVYEHYTRIPNNTWLYPDARQLEVQIKEDGFYDISILIRNTDEYSWNNLWVTLESKKPDGKNEKGIYNFRLADIGGRWLGRGPGGLHDHRFLVKQNFKMPAGNYAFILKHNMREESIRGISEVGLQIVKVK